MRINLVFGVPGGIDASPEALDAMLRPLPPETFWTVTCIGRHHQRMLALALLRGAPGIRTGLEDVAYISRGVHAPSNAALVEMAVDLAAHARPRGRHPGADEGAARAWLSPAEIVDATAPRRGPETREAIHAAAVDLFARARLPRDLDAGARRRRRGAAGGDLPLVPEQGGDPGPAPGRLHGAAHRSRGRAMDEQDRPALKLAAAVREHVVYHGLHTSEAFVTDSEIRALTRRAAPRP